MDKIQITCKGVEYFFSVKYNNLNNILKNLEKLSLKQNFIKKKGLDIILDNIVFFKSLKKVFLNDNPISTSLSLEEKNCVNECLDKLEKKRIIYF